MSVPVPRDDEGAGVVVMVAEEEEGSFAEDERKTSFRGGRGLKQDIADLEVDAALDVADDPGINVL